MNDPICVSTSVLGNFTRESIYQTFIYVKTVKFLEN